MSSAVYATDITWGNAGNAGGDVSMGTATATNPLLTVSASPGVLVSGTNSETEYGIVTANFKSGSYGIAYNVHSGSGKIFQIIHDMSAYDSSTVVVATPLIGATASNFASK